MSASLELSGIGQRFGQTVALADIDLVMPAGALVPGETGGLLDPA